MPLPVLDFLRVTKSARTLELWQGEPGKGGRLVHVIEGLQFGDSPQGHKRFEGDERTPEGRYVIDWGNPNLRYHLSLHISYPNAADRAYARARGRSPGGMIMLHGQPNGWGEGRVPGDWTDGCIALSNAEIEALWEAVPDGTPIEIRP
ncbi:L,D-transpeptidase family protein [Novosphingobium decolorationis]|uniref:L,D-transpeptidase family protein n=1 Tax=Novosphingobium decolorationis TaxID=2698673 RepID=UPI0030CA9A41